MAGNAFAGWRARAGRSPETVDRILVGGCALIWLVLLGMSVAAGVALVDLGRGFHKPTHDAHTGLLYIIIGVSALIVLAAVPVLLRARNALPARSPIRPGERATRRGFADRGTGRSAAGAPLIGPDTDPADRVLLRGTTELASVIGTALIAVAVATYLMAVGKDGAAWAGYGVAGVIVAAMPVVPWLHLRQLRELLGARQR